MLKHWKKVKISTIPNFLIINPKPPLFLLDNTADAPVSVTSPPPLTTVATPLHPRCWETPSSSKTHFLLVPAATPECTLINTKTASRPCHSIECNAYQGHEAAQGGRQRGRGRPACAGLPTDQDSWPDVLLERAPALQIKFKPPAHDCVLRTCTTTQPTSAASCRFQGHRHLSIDLFYSPSSTPCHCPLSVGFRPYATS